MNDVLILEAGVGHRQHPPGASGSRLLPIQTAVDQNPRQPDFERQIPLKRSDVRVRLDKGVLHRLVGFRRIPEVVPRDPRRAALQIVRAVVDERTAARSYPDRLMGYNNDKNTTLADVQSVFKDALGRLRK